MDVIGLSGRQSPSPMAREQAIHRVPSGDSASSRSVRRVPSWDTMSRSIHNDSGHGKSSAQTIRDLRASNAKLTDRMAEMEAEFMNQMNQTRMRMSTLEDSIKTKDQEIAAFESRTLSTEKRIQDRDTQVTQLKEENAFQRHTISDLKNQMYQLQSDIEDAQYDKQDEINKWEEKVKDAERRVEQAEKAVGRELGGSNDDTSKELQKKIDDMEVKLLLAEERATESEKLARESERRAAKAEARAIDTERDGFSVASKESDDRTASQNWSQIDNLQEALDISEKRLYEAKSTLTDVEEDNRRLIIENAEKEMKYRDQLETMQEEFRRNIQDKDCDEELANLRYEGKKKDDNIESLREQVRLYQDEIKAIEAGWKTKFEKSKSNQSLYEEDIRKELQTKCKDMEREISDLKSTINARDDTIESLNTKAHQHREELQSLNLKLEEARSMAKEGAKRPALLEEINDQAHQISRQQAELAELKSLLDEKTRRLEEQKIEFTEQTDINEDLNKEISDLRKQVKVSREESEQAMDAAEKKSRSREDELEKELNKSKAELAAFERTLRDKAAEHDDVVSDLKKEIEEISMNMLESEAKHKRRISILESDLSELEHVRDETIAQLKTLSEKEQAARELAQEEESKEIQRLRSEVEKAANDRSRVEEELKRQLQSVKSTNDVVFEEMESELAAKTAALETYQRDVELQKEEVETLTTELEQLRTSSEQIVNDLRNELETTKTMFEDEKRDAEERICKIEAEKSLWESRKSDLEEDKQTLEAQIDEYQKGQLDLKEHIAALKAQMQSVEDNSQNVGGIKKQLEDAHMALARIENEKNKSEKEREDKESALRIELVCARDKISTLEAKYSKETSELEKTKENMIEGYIVDIAEKEDAIARLNLAVSAQEQRLSDITAELAAVNHHQEIESKKYQDENKKLREKIKSLESDAQSAGLSNFKDLTVELQAIKAALRHKDIELAETRAALNSQRKRYHNLADPPLTQSDSEDSEERGVEISMDEDLSYSKFSEKQTEKEAKLHDHIVSLEDQISQLTEEKDDVISELKGKLDDRDTTISALVKSSVVQEQKLSKVKAEVRRLNSHYEINLRDTDELDSARNADQQEQLELMRREIDSYRRVEEGLSKDLSVVKNDLRAANLETMRLRSQLEQSQKDSRSRSNNAVVETRIATLQKEKEQMVKEHKGQIKERDDAISSLVKSSVTQEKRVTKLQSQYEELKKKDAKADSGPSWKELRRLQQESEIFASQVIEQDREIDGLKTALEEKNRMNSDLKKEISSLRAKLDSLEKETSNLADLKAHLEEVKSNNTRQREGLREMRKKVKDTIIQSDRIKELETEIAAAKSALKDMEEKIKDQSKQEDKENSLRKDLSEAIESKEATEERLTRQIENLRRLRTIAIESHEERLREKDRTIDTMEEEAQKQGSKIVSLRNELRELRINMNENPQADEEAAMKQALRLAKAELSEEMGMVKLKNEALNREIENLKDQLRYMERSKDNGETDATKRENYSLRRKLEDLESQSISSEDSMAKISELKAQLEEAQNGRASFEKNALSTFERKMSLMQLNKDLTIDNLRKELAISKEKQSEKEIEQLSRLQAVEREYREYKQQSEMEIKQNNSKIFALQQTLDAQEQVVGNMGSEMDQLHNNMEKETLRRRAEVEELEREVVESSTKVTRLERKITELKMKHEDRKLRHNAEVEKLQRTITTLETESPLARGIQSQRDDHRIEDLNEKLEKLKWRNASLQEENHKLRDKSESYDIEEKASKNDKWRNAALQEQVAILTKKNHELENAVVSMSSRSAANKSSQSSASRRVVSESPIRSRNPGPKVPMSPIHSPAPSVTSARPLPSPSRPGSRNSTPKSSPKRRGISSLIRRKSKEFSREELQAISDKDARSTHTDFTF